MMAKDSEEQYVAEMSFDDLKNEIISNLESVDVIVKASESSKGTCRLDIQTSTAYLKFFPGITRNAGRGLIVGFLMRSA